MNIYRIQTAAPHLSKMKGQNSVTRAHLEASTCSCPGAQIPPTSVVK